MRVLSILAYAAREGLYSCTRELVFEKQLRAFSICIMPLLMAVGAVVKLSAASAVIPPGSPASRGELDGLHSQARPA